MGFLCPRFQFKKWIEPLNTILSHSSFDKFMVIFQSWVPYPLHTQDQNPNYPTFEKPDSSLYICRRQLERAGHILRPIITCTISRNIMIFRRRPSHRKIMWSFGDDFPQWVKKKKKSGIYDDIICPAIKGKEIQNVISLSSLFPKNAFFLYLLSVDTLWILLHLWNDDLKVHSFLE